MISPCTGIEKLIQKQIKECFHVESHVIYPTPWKDSMVTFKFHKEHVTVMIPGDCSPEGTQVSFPQDGYTYWQKKLCDAELK